MSYPIKYRRQVMKVKKEENLTYEETMKRFGLGRTTLFRWKKEIAPKKGRNKPATKIDMDKLKTDVERYPDKYQYERAEDFKVTQGAIFYALKRLGLSRKKTLNHPKADELTRIRFQCQLIRYQVQGRKIVYVDESGFAVDAPRTHGYTQTGKRCYDEKDWHCKGRVNAIGAIDDNNIPITVDLWDCNIVIRFKITKYSPL